MHADISTNSVSDTNTRDLQGSSYVLQFPVSKGGSPRHYGFDEEWLVPFAFLKASNDAEAPAFQVAFGKDNILTAVKVAVETGSQNQRKLIECVSRKTA